MLYFTYGAHGLVDTHNFPRTRYAALVRFTTVER
jgi:hypothetical protein